MKTMRKYKPIAAIQNLTPAQRDQLATWLENHPYHKTMDLAADAWGIQIKYHEVQRHYHRLQLAKQLGINTDELLDLYNGEFLPVHPATEHVIQKKTLALALSDDHTPSQLRNLQRIASNPIHIELAQTRLKIAQQNADTHARNAQTKIDKLQLDRDKLAHTQSTHPQPSPQSDNPESDNLRIESDSQSDNLESDNLLISQPEPHPKKIKLHPGDVLTTDTDKHIIAQYHGFQDCDRLPQTGEILHGPHKPFGCGVLLTEIWDHKMFEIDGLIDVERKKRCLYNAMRDLGVADDLAAFYRDEINLQAGVTTNTHHFLPTLYNQHHLGQVDPSYTALQHPIIKPPGAQFPISPATLHLPHFGRPSDQIKDLIWPLKAHPIHHRQIPVIPQLVNSPTSPSQSDNPESDNLIIACTGCTPCTPCPTCAEPPPFHGEETYRRHRLKRVILDLGLTPELAHAYCHEILQLGRPEIIPWPTAYKSPRCFSGAPELDPDQLVTRKIYPTPAQIHLHRYKIHIHKNCPTRWSLKTDPEATTWPWPPEPKPEPEPQTLTHPDYAPGFHPETDEQTRMDNYHILREIEADDAFSYEKHGKNAGRNFHTQYKHCPCGHYLPCPYHPPLPDSFYTSKTTEDTYIVPLVEAGFPFDGLPNAKARQAARTQQP